VDGGDAVSTDKDEFAAKIRGMLGEAVEQASTATMADLRRVVSGVNAAIGKVVDEVKRLRGEVGELREEIERLKSDRDPIR
jgi:methyl-accepting chemotaxis protein